MPTRARALLQTQLKRLQDGLRRVNCNWGRKRGTLVSVIG